MNNVRYADFARRPFETAVLASVPTPRLQKEGAVHRAPGYLVLPNSFAMLDELVRIYWGMPLTVDC